jgi:hypothetical protein
VICLTKKQKKISRPKDQQAYKENSQSYVFYLNKDQNFYTLAKRSFAYTATKLRFVTLCNQKQALLFLVIVWKV